MKEVTSPGSDEAKGKHGLPSLLLPCVSSSPAPAPAFTMGLDGLGAVQLSEGHRTEPRWFMGSFLTVTASPSAARMPRCPPVVTAVVSLVGIIYALSCPPSFLCSWSYAIISLLLQIIAFIGNMVSINWGSVIARAAFLLSSPNTERASDPIYSQNANYALAALGNWYNASTGLWTTTGWWNSANCLQVLADSALLDPAGSQALNVSHTIANTFSRAPLAPVPHPAVQRRSISASSQTHDTLHRHKDLKPRAYAGFLNDFYDDEGWWALAWIRSWDYTGDSRYLETAQTIFEDMRNGTDNVCGGGIWWSKERKYKNAIANELYLSVAASLSMRVPGKKDYYLDIAKQEWDWFKNSGMINNRSLINDGLRMLADGRCVNNGDRTWSYNQGVVLGGLAELYRATGNKTYLDQALEISQAAITLLSDSNGVIQEGCEPSSCGGDGTQFKGIFVRNLHYLHAVAPRDYIRRSILVNADSIWENNRDPANNWLGVTWSGPVNAGGGPNASTHSSATDVLVAAMAVVA